VLSAALFGDESVHKGLLRSWFTDPATRLVDPDATQLLVVRTAAPGTESHEKLELRSVTGETPANRGTWSSR
jgi:hypothetical protein